MIGRKKRRMYWRKATNTPSSMRPSITFEAPYHSTSAMPTVPSNSVKGKKMAKQWISRSSARR